MPKSTIYTNIFISLCLQTTGTVYYYWGFELNIASEIEFPELLPAWFDVADLVIRIGEVNVTVGPDEENERLAERVISNTEYYLYIKNVCKYHVLAGKEIIIAPCEGAGGRSIRIYLLATVMAVVLLQRGSIPLHASGILKDGQLILFTGDSGAGKSTTLAYLVSQGYRIFTDDICILKVNTDIETRVLGVASYPMLKLWGDAVEKLDDDAYSEKTFKVNNDMDKYGYFFYGDFIKEPYPIGKIFILKKNDTIDRATVRQLSGIDAFREVEKQAYRMHLITNQGQRELHFKTMSLLTQNCSVFEVNRPVNGTVEELAAMLTAMF